jgi:hypothetical protein
VRTPAEGRSPTRRRRRSPGCRHSHLASATRYSANRSTDCLIPAFSPPVTPAERLGGKDLGQGLGNTTQKTECEVRDGRQSTDIDSGNRRQKCNLAAASPAVTASS